MDTGNTAGIKYDNTHIRTCLHCGRLYDWRHSTADFKFSYCWMFCQLRQENVSIDEILRLQRPQKPSVTDIVVVPAVSPDEQAAFQRIMTAIREG